MKNILIIYVLFFFLVILGFSCRKGGLGGSTTIIITVTHHGKPIPGAKVFVKYGSYNFPGKDTSIYNAKQLTNVDGYTTFENLSTGYFYFYALGIDSLIKQNVTGNAGLKIKHKEIGSELELNVPVTE